MSREARLLRKKNNARDKEISPENEEIYTNMVVYMRSSDIVYTDQTEHTARRFSAWLPPIQCTLSGHQCMMLIQV